MSPFKWQEGRQDGGYLKFTLIQKSWIPFDLYILKFPDESYIDSHSDPVPKYKHIRLNIELKKANFGGFFLCDTSKGGFCKRFWRFTLFRPDICYHSVSRVEGTRYVLSIGWLWPF